jgi:hypothetical protein
MSSDFEAPRPSRRDLMRQAGKVALGVAGTGLLAPAQQATQEVAYPFKTWQLNGQDAYIFADPATRTYYRTTTGAPQVRMSKNLVDWTAPITMLTDPPLDQRWFSNEMPWACEMHTYKGKYYIFYTRHNSATISAKSDLAAEANPYSVWQTENARASVIAVADSPLGPFTGLDNSRPVTDPRFMTLDGTFIVDEEGPWMVYCHEWVQKIDGGIEAIPLTPDLRAAAGDPILLFRGSDASWRRRAKEYNQGTTPAIDATQSAPYVTDGCELSRTPNGSLLMIWTGPGGRYSYDQVQAISRSGRVRGPWEQVYREPFMHGNRGHGNLFRTFEGQDMLVVMNRSAQGGLANGTRSEYYEVEIGEEGVKVLRHRKDLDGQVGLALEDKTPPDLYLPPNQVVDATSPAGAVVGYSAMAHAWRQGPVPLKVSHNSGATFAIGTTTVVCSAQDNAGNTSEENFTVHVKGAGEQIAAQLALIQLAKPKSGTFQDTLNAAQSRLEAGDKAGVRKQLSAFTQFVRAESGKALSVSLANRLLANAERIAALIGS